MVTAADRTLPNLGVIPVVGENLDLTFPFVVTPAVGWNTVTAIGGMPLQAGGAPLRFVFSIPDHMRSDDSSLKVLAWCSIAGKEFTVHPTEFRRFGDGFGMGFTDGAVIAGEAIRPLDQHKKYVLEISGLDADTIHFSFWEECGGAPLHETDFVETDILATDIDLAVGWPPEEVIAGVALTDDLENSTNNDYTPYTHYPYMMKMHYVGAGDVGVTSVTFMQERALVQAEDVPAGTYVGYFTPVHPLGIQTHIALDDVGLEAEYEVKNNKLYTKVAGSTLTLHAGTAIPVNAVDVFNVTLDLDTTGTLTVTA
jgi:hypothetical protein